MSRGVNWVLDADIRSFFDSVDHEWLLRMVAHRIADPRILRLIRPMAARPASWRAASGTRRTRERRRVRASARSWPTSSCITSSISGSINGVGGMHAAVSRSCAMPMTS